MVTFWLLPIFIFVWIEDSKEESFNSCRDNAPGRHCHHLLPAEKLREIGFVPSEQQLFEICPKILTYFRCLREYADKCPLDEREVIEPIFATNEVAFELCDVESSLHKSYLLSLPCYKNVSSLDIGLKCTQKAEIIYNRYVLYRNEESDEVEDSDRTRHRYCMEESHKMACIYQNIALKCGTVAGRTFKSLVTRSKILRRVCSEDTIEEMLFNFEDFIFTQQDKEYFIGLIGYI